VSPTLSPYSQSSRDSRLCGAIIIALPAATPKELRNEASFAFGGFVNCECDSYHFKFNFLTIYTLVSRWSDGFAFIVSFLTPLWTLGAFDASLHLSEEATNASTAIPYAIISSTVLSLIFGWGGATSVFALSS